MNPWHDIDPGKRAPEVVDCIIEVPRGSRNKYELDKKTGLLRLDRVLYSAVFYPANYGFIPRTYCDDRDPLDILVLGQEPVVPMCILTARPIGMMQMVDQNEEDDKIIAIHENDPAVAHFRDISQLPEHALNELQRFFEDYKILEHKKVRIERFFGRVDAQNIIAKSLRLYTDSYNPDGSKRADAPMLNSERAEMHPSSRSISPGARLDAARRAAAHNTQEADARDTTGATQFRSGRGEDDGLWRHDSSEFDGAARSSAPPASVDHQPPLQSPFEDDWTPAQRPPLEPIAFDLRTLENHAPRVGHDASDADGAAADAAAATPSLDGTEAGSVPVVAKESAEVAERIQLNQNA
jgi:inorganic pyrophosphatase